MRWSFFLLALVGTIGAAALACGKGGNQFDNDGAIDDDGGNGDENDFLNTDGGGEGGLCRVCSSDLHSVLDCDNNVITTCPPDQGCGPDGMCVPACDSARANQSTVGCDYYAVNPGAFAEFHGSCYAVYIANTWTSDVTITASYGSQSLNIAGLARIPSGSGTVTYSPLPNGKLPAGKFAILFLSDATGVTNPILPSKCPMGVTPGITTMDTASPNTEYIKGFKISTSAPVQAFDIFPYGGSASYGSSATLLLPVSAWGTNYLSVHGYAKSMAHGGDKLFVQIASDEDGNQVTIVGTSAIVGGTGVAPANANTPHTYSVNKGQVLQLMQDGDLSGSPIKSTKPVGLWGGNQCFNIETNDFACDSAHQQVPPIAAMGHEYVAVRHRDRASQPEVPPWRILGAVDGTKLTYAPSTPMGAPTTINARQIVKFNSSGPFIVKSQDDQHPFYMAGHMLGASTPNAAGTGDPEFVNVIPPQQYLDKYIFMTDPTMSYTSITLVRGKAKDATYKDVKLDCQSSNVAGWQPISGTDFQSTTVELVNAGQGVGGCNNGLHTVSSTAPFGLTVWGWDSYVSYAYPGGASVKPINSVIVQPTPK
jgi:hypothetical protein